MTTVSISIRGFFPLAGQVLGLVMVLIGLYPYWSFLVKKNWVSGVFWSSFGVLFLFSVALFVFLILNLVLQIW